MEKRWGGRWRLQAPSITAGRKHSFRTSVCRTLRERFLLVSRMETMRGAFAYPLESTYDLVLVVDSTSVALYRLRVAKLIILAAMEQCGMPKTLTIQPFIGYVARGVQA